MPDKDIEQKVSGSTRVIREEARTVSWAHSWLGGLGGQSSRQQTEARMQKEALLRTWDTWDSSACENPTENLRAAAVGLQSRLLRTSFRGHTLDPILF